MAAAGVSCFSLRKLFDYHLSLSLAVIEAACYSVGLRFSQFCFIGRVDLSDRKDEFMSLYCDAPDFNQGP